MKKQLIPVMKPLLPTQEYITPYLKQIDQSRWYANRGPLALELEKRLQAHIGLGPFQLVTLSSGTAALTTTLKALQVPEGSYCIMPSWTFSATASAAIAAGLKPLFVDVDAASWSLTPDILQQQLPLISGNIGAVISVAPFGAPCDMKRWDDFTKETGIKVVIDAAAAFDAISTLEIAKPSQTPMIVSMHATKTFGIGEGGFIASTDTNLIRDITRFSNLGLGEIGRECSGINAKISEYAAAVGHAALDQWERKKAGWRQVTDHYIDALDDANISHNLSKDWVGSTCNIVLDGVCADDVILLLNNAGIESRKWWLDGCHNKICNSRYSCLDLSTTNSLIDSVVGIPFSVDMHASTIDDVVKELSKIAAMSDSEVQEKLKYFEKAHI